MVESLARRDGNRLLVFRLLLAFIVTCLEEGRLTYYLGFLTERRLGELAMIKSMLKL